jgi:hypothetical protein
MTSYKVQNNVKITKILIIYYDKFQAGEDPTCIATD